MKVQVSMCRLSRAVAARLAVVKPLLADAEKDALSFVQGMVPPKRSLLFQLLGFKPRLANYYYKSIDSVLKTGRTYSFFEDGDYFPKEAYRRYPGLGPVLKKYCDLHDEVSRLEHYANKAYETPFKDSAILELGPILRKALEDSSDEDF